MKNKRKIIYTEHLCFLYNYKTGKSLITLLKNCEWREQSHHKYSQQKVTNLRPCHKLEVLFDGGPIHLSMQPNMQFNEKITSKNPRQWECTNCIYLFSTVLKRVNQEEIMRHYLFKLVWTKDWLKIKHIPKFGFEEIFTREIAMLEMNIMCSNNIEMDLLCTYPL